MSRPRRQRLAWGAAVGAALSLVAAPVGWTEQANRSTGSPQASTERERDRPQVHPDRDQRHVNAEALKRKAAEQAAFEQQKAAMRQQLADLEAQRDAAQRAGRRDQVRLYNRYIRQVRKQSKSSRQTAAHQAKNARRQQARQDRGDFFGDVGREGLVWERMNPAERLPASL